MSVESMDTAEEGLLVVRFYFHETNRALLDLSCVIVRVEPLQLTFRKPMIWKLCGLHLPNVTFRLWSIYIHIKLEIHPFITITEQ